MYFCSHVLCVFTLYLFICFGMVGTMIGVAETIGVLPEE